MSQDTFPVPRKDRTTQRHDKWPWLSFFLKESVWNLNAWSCCGAVTTASIVLKIYWHQFCRHKQQTCNQVLVFVCICLGYQMGGFYHVRRTQIMLGNLAVQTCSQILCDHVNLLTLVVWQCVYVCCMKQKQPICQLTQYHTCLLLTITINVMESALHCTYM